MIAVGTSVRVTGHPAINTGLDHHDLHGVEGIVTEITPGKPTWGPTYGDVLLDVQRYGISAEYEPTPIGMPLILWTSEVEEIPALGVAAYAARLKAARQVTA